MREAPPPGKRIMFYFSAIRLDDAPVELGGGPENKGPGAFNVPKMESTNERKAPGRKGQELFGHSQCFWLLLMFLWGREHATTDANNLD